ncbi:MAG: PorT family protein [Cyclobacteriaceae bacterium]|nr:PorT family protein [Cyclobacteriaceae bacterium]
MKTIIVVISLFAVTICAYAQPQVAAGIKGGLNLASFNVKHEYEDSNKEYTSLTTYRAGVFASIQFNKLSIQPEILFSQQGTKLDYSTEFNPDPKDWESNFTYINIPVVVKYQLIQTGLGNINIQAGPQYGILQKAETNFADFDGDGAQERPKRDVKEEYQKSDIGLILGLGWDLPFGLTLDLRYSLGLRSIDS